MKLVPAPVIISYNGFSTGDIVRLKDFPEFGTWIVLEPKQDSQGLRIFNKETKKMESIPWVAKIGAHGPFTQAMRSKSLAMGRAHPRLVLHQDIVLEQPQSVPKAPELPLEEEPEQEPEEELTPPEQL